MVGGGSLPGEGLESAVCAIAAPPGGADAFAAALRGADPPIVARIERGAVLLDPRTVAPSDDRHVADSLRALCQPEAGDAGGGPEDSAGR